MNSQSVHDYRDGWVDGWMDGSVGFGFVLGYGGMVLFTGTVWIWVGF